MLPNINGKSFLDCNYTDLQLLIDNLDYRENEYIDYKQNFAFLEMEDRKVKESKKVEFRNDICSFANTEGGYLVFGVSEDNGCATEITGITISNKNTDSFELNIRNTLNGIYPRLPNIKFHFVEAPDDKYVVIIYIKHDSFAPYTHIEEQKNYKFYKRSGSEKVIISYAELKNMFDQSMSLGKEIQNYRKERIDYYKSLSETDDDAYSKFMLFHIIPDTFLDVAHYQNMFAIEHNGGIGFSPIFKEFLCNNSSTPCVDGLRFQQFPPRFTPAVCYINNNGIIECFLSLYDVPTMDNNFIPSDYLWDKIKTTLVEYIERFEKKKLAERVFLCLSIIGCKGMLSETTNNISPFKGKIDRNNIMCTPVEIEDIADSAKVDTATKMFYIEFKLSIGVNYEEQLRNLIKEIYC